MAVSNDGNMYLYRLPQGKPVRRIKAYQAAISLTVLSPDGQFALTFGRDDMQHMKLKLWKISSGSLVRAIALGDDQIGFLAISPDNRRALSGGDQSTQGSKTRLWDLDKGRAMKTLLGEKGWGGPVAFSPKGKLALMTMSKNSAGDTKEHHFVLWNIPKWKMVRTLEGWPGEKPTFLAKGKQLVAYSSENKVKFWDVKTGKLVKSVTVFPGYAQGLNKKKLGAAQTPATIHALGLSREGNLAVAVTGDNFVDQDSIITIKIWDLARKRLLCSWQDPTGK